MSTRRGAELMFRENDWTWKNGKAHASWSGKLPSSARDRQDGDALVGRYICRIEDLTGALGADASIIGHLPNGQPVYASDARYLLTTQGGHRGGRRYSEYPTVTAAQNAALGWARRRFYIEMDAA